MPIHPNKRVKKLSISDEEFFVHCLQLLGPPDAHAIYNFVGTNTYKLKGIHPYLRDSEHGRAFVRMVADFGEARARAPRWLFRYIRWWRNQQIRHVGES